MNKEKELINISYFDNQELSIKEHCDIYRKIVGEITNILRKYDIKFVLGETEVCKDLQLKLEEKQKIIDETIKYIKDNLTIASILDGKTTYCLNSYSFEYEDLLKILERGKNVN